MVADTLCWLAGGEIQFTSSHACCSEVGLRFSFLAKIVALCLVVAIALSVSVSERGTFGGESLIVAVAGLCTPVATRHFTKTLSGGPLCGIIFLVAPPISLTGRFGTPTGRSRFETSAGGVVSWFEAPPRARFLQQERTVRWIGWLLELEVCSAERSIVGCL